VQLGLMRKGMPAVAITGSTDSGDLSGSPIRLHFV
jgi:hypothetical protein